MNQPVTVVTVEPLEALFSAHYGRLVRALTLVAGDRDTAADAVQEAFVKAHLHWRKVQHYEDPVGWIRRVAINKLRDHHRGAGRKLRLVDRLRAEPEVDVEGPVVDEQLDGRYLLRELPKQQRLSLALYYIDGLSVAEVASALGISEGAVKFHLHQGRDRLRGQVAATQDDTGPDHSNLTDTKPRGIS